MPATTPALQHPAFEALADLYTYPRPGAVEPARASVRLISSVCPEAAEHLMKLLTFMETTELWEREELYVRTFELNPACALEIGWQLYGEQYARGTFLVTARQLTLEAGLPLNTELPDHLPNVLRILARLDGPSAEKLAARFTAPAVSGMVEKFVDTPDNPYCGLLMATSALLRQIAPTPDADDETAPGGDA